jgi:hypothetical protein
VLRLHLIPKPETSNGRVRKLQGRYQCPLEHLTRKSAFRGLGAYQSRGSARLPNVNIASMACAKILQILHAYWSGVARLRWFAQGGQGTEILIESFFFGEKRSLTEFYSQWDERRRLHG